VGQVFTGELPPDVVGIIRYQDGRMSVMFNADYTGISANGFALIGSNGEVKTFVDGGI
jgi:hypothetical protein